MDVKMLLHFLLPVALTLSAVSCRQAAIPSNWVQYSRSSFSCNVVISSPHGGALQPSEIANRTNGCLAPDGVTCRWEKGCSPVSATACRAVLGADSHTQEVASLVVKHLSETYNCIPHFIRSNLHRSKLDPNRPMPEAAQGNPFAQAAWRTYHFYMNTAVDALWFNHRGRGLVIDIHGQSHPEQWTELGYVVSKVDLNAGPKNLTGSSIRGLAARSRLSAVELISGYLSFGSMLEASGYKTVPSLMYPSPGNGSYFEGGYITQQYGSRVTGEIDAIQVEIASGIRMDSVKREKFAADLARAIVDFRTAHGY